MVGLKAELLDPIYPDSLDKNPIEFEADWIKSIEVDNIEKIDEFQTLYGLTGQYLIGDSYKIITVNFLPTRSGAQLFYNLRQIREQTDSLRADPITMKLYYKYQLEYYFDADLTFIYAQMDRWSYDLIFKEGGSNKKRSFAVRFIETNPPNVAVKLNKIGVPE